MDAHGQLGIMQRTIPLGFQNQITEFIDGIASVPRLPADGDGLPVRVPLPGLAAARGNGQIHKLRNVGPQQSSSSSARSRVSAPDSMSRRK